MPPSVRTLAMLACAASFTLGNAYAQGPAPYPSKPIQLVIPFETGGLMDNVGRIVAQAASEGMGQPVVAINRPGASEAIGVEAAARAAPDGYTVLASTQTGLVLNVAMRKELPYDTRRDLSAVSTVFSSPLWLVVHPSVPVNTVQELVSAAKSQPGKFTYASIGPGSTLHLAGELFKIRTGTDVLHVPYKGSPSAFVDLLAGRVNLMFSGAGSALPAIRSGKLRALASTGPKRSTVMPNVPSMMDAGVPDFAVTTWLGVFTPAKTPRPIIDRLNTEVRNALRSKVLQDRAATDGLELNASTPEELTERVRTEIPYWTDIIRKIGLQK